MSPRGLEIRLRKLEGRRKPNGLFFVWGRTDEELNAILAEASSHGELSPTDPNVCVIWAGNGLPASGWRAYKDLTDSERDALKANLKVRAADADGSEPDHRIRQIPTEQLLPIALGRPVPRLAMH